MLRSGSTSLVEQGLEGVVVLAVDQHDPHRLARGPQAAESSPDDHHARRRGQWHVHRRLWMPPALARAAVGVVGFAASGSV
jgi:hypothetical protein